VQKKIREKRQKEILQGMKRLASSQVNDAVKLTYLEETQMEDIGSLDLTALKEFKRGSNGAVEIKLLDKAEVLEKMMDMLERCDDSEDFFQALTESVSKEQDE
jgi:hypothetical protein